MTSNLKKEGVITIMKNEWLSMLFASGKLEWTSAIFAGVATGTTALFGGWDKAFQVFILCVVLDIITGVLKGLIAEKGFSSKRMRQGFATKFGYLIIVVLATQFDKLMPEELPVIRTLVIYFYVAVEASSIVENLAQMGVPIPQVIIDRLSALKGKTDSDKDEIKG